MIDKTEYAALQRYVNENKRTFFRIASSETRSAKAMTNQMATHDSQLITQSSLLKAHRSQLFALPCHPKNKLLSPEKHLFRAGHSSQNAVFIGILLKVINNGGAHDDDLPQLPILRIERLAAVMPTFSASSPEVILHLAECLHLET